MNFVTEYWERILGCSVAVIGLIYSIRGFELRNIKERARKEQFYRDLEIELANLKKDMEADSDRIDKLSALCIDQIKSNKEASVKAESASAKIDTIIAVYKKRS